MEAFMKKRQRLIDTLNHKEPDRVVMDFGATAITGMSANCVYALKKHYGIDTPTRIHEPFQLLGEIDEDMRQALGVDVVDVTDNSNMFGFQNEGWKPWHMQSGIDVEVPKEFNTTVDENGTTYIYPKGDMSVPPSARMPKGGFYFDNITRTAEPFDMTRPNNNAKSDFKEDFALYTDEALRNIEERCTYLYNNTDYGLIGGGALASIGDFAMIPGPGVKHPKGLRNLEEFMMAPYICPNYVKELFDFQTEIGIENAKLFKQATGDMLQAMVVSGTDFGSQHAPFMSVDAFKEFYQPYYTRINQWIHENTVWKTFFHSCGSIVPIIPELIKSGMDILNPVQISASGMNPRMLKDTYGDKITFWGGGVDTQKVLPFGTAEEVYTHVTEMLHIFAPGGGYVFNAVHNIQGQTPVENILALLQAYEDYNT